MTTPAASTDTTTTNAGQSFKIAVTNTSGSNINTAYGSLGTFPYMNADNRPDATNLADLYLKVWQDSTTYTAIKNGWSVVTGTDTAAALKTFSGTMSSTTDPWSDYRFAILNKIDLSAYQTQHTSKFKFGTATAETAGYYLDYFVGYCVYQDTFGGVCAEAAVETTWDNYLSFNAPAAAPAFSFAAARFKKDALIIKLAATDTDHTPVAIATAETAVTGTTAIAAASASEIVGTDAFVGTSETFGQSRRVVRGGAQLAETGTFGCATDNAVGNCGNGTATYSAALATTNLDYTAIGQSGFAMIGAGASYKNGAMWSYLWGWVPTTTTANQTNSHDLTFESGVKYINWSVTRDLFIADGTGAGTPGTVGCNSATQANGCKAASTECNRACAPLTAAAVPARTAKDLTVTRVAMSGSSLVASAAAAIVAASLAF